MWEGHAATQAKGREIPQNEMRLKMGGKQGESLGITEEDIIVMEGEKNALSFCSSGKYGGLSSEGGGVSTKTQHLKSPGTKCTS